MFYKKPPPVYIKIPKKGNNQLSCTLSFYLKYNYYNRQVNFIEHENTNEYHKSKKNRQPYLYMCNSFECLKTTFENFLLLYNLCKKLYMKIDYNSKRFTLEEEYCEAESQKIRNEIERLTKKYLPKKNTLRNIYLKENTNGTKIYVPQRKTRTPK